MARVVSSGAAASMEVCAIASTAHALVPWGTLARTARPFALLVSMGRDVV